MSVSDLQPLTALQHQGLLGAKPVVYRWPTPATPAPAPAAPHSAQALEGLVRVQGPVQVGGVHITPPRLRTGVLQRLTRATKYLPGGYGLCLLEGWSAAAWQATIAKQQGAPPPAGSCVLPHATGGAVDVTLAHLGQPLALGSLYRVTGAATHMAHYEATNSRAGVLARDARRLLAGVMVQAGFAPHRTWWWHWEYGTAWWAAYYGKPAAHYPVAAPPAQH